MGTKFPHLMTCWKRNTVSGHRKNSQALAAEVYKIFNKMFPTIINIFAPRTAPFNQRDPVSFKSPLGLQWNLNSIPFRTKNLELSTT